MINSLLDKLISNKQIIFLGDSHVEYLSRVKFKNIAFIQITLDQFG